jgi:exonuclease SbcC
MHERWLRRVDRGSDSPVILKSLSLENFRSFASARIEFGARQNYVVGSNWQGKSSLVEGIAFALFGTEALPKRMAGSAVRAEHLVLDGANKGHVELVFEVDEREYTLRRGLPRPLVKLLCDGVEFASSHEPVKEKLRELLAIDAKFFGNVFYADQDELRRSFDLTPKDRRLFIERLLGQEVWQERVDGLRRAESHLRSFIGELVTGRYGAFVQALDELTADIANGKREAQELATSIAELRRALPRSGRGLRDREKLAGSKVAEVQQEETAATSEHDVLERLIDDLASGKCPTCSQPVPLKLRKDRLADLRRQLRASAAELRRLRSTLEGLEADIAEEDFDTAHLNLNELNELTGRHETLTREQRKKVDREKVLRAKAKVFGKAPAQHQRAHEEVEFLGRVIEVVEAHRAGLRDRVAHELVVAMNALLARFHDGDFDATAIIGGDMDLGVNLHGRTVSLANLSGAARDVFAIALRYGLMRVAARRVDCMILDEPTRHMDPKNVRQLKAVFDDLDDRQLVVVTIQGEFGDARGSHFAVSKDENLRSVLVSGC